ncbi:hypothetical protein ACFY8S_36520 [Streptomyces hygroscopicus]|uniref:hypothetical protein n=1 Tax=Streptomyces hygroscopicus TaxID=1912 RepID=UPI003689D1D0
MGWKEPSAAEQQLSELLKVRGMQVSWAKIRRWREFGALPWRKQHGLGRGAGSASGLTADTVVVAEALALATVKKRRMEEAVLHVFTVHPRCREAFVATSVPLPERAVRKALRWSIGQDRSTALAAVGKAIEAAGDDADQRMDAALAAAHSYYGKWHRRTRRPAEGKAADAVPQSRADAQGLATFAVAAVLGFEEIGADGLIEALRNSYESADDEVFSAAAFADMRDLAQEAERLGEDLFPRWTAWTSTAEKIRLMEEVDYSTICVVHDVLAVLVDSAPVLRLASRADLQDPALQHIKKVRARNQRTDYYLNCADAISRRPPAQAWKAFIPLLTEICANPTTLGLFQTDVSDLDPALDDMPELGRRAMDRLGAGAPSVPSAPQ